MAWKKFMVTIYEQGVSKGRLYVEEAPDKEAALVQARLRDLRKHFSAKIDHNRTTVQEV